MHRLWKLGWLCSSAVVLLASTASPQTLGRTEVFLGSAGDERAVSLSRDGAATIRGSATLDYTTFAYELLAFLTKEVLSDSPEEYPESSIGSRLSGPMPEGPSEFGSHCLTIVTRIGSAVPFLSGKGSELAGGNGPALDDVARAAAAALALRRAWSDFDKDAPGDRRSVSVKPKLGTDKVGISLTFRW